jgi:hypothetical protein
MAPSRSAKNPPDDDRPLPHHLRRQRHHLMWWHLPLAWRPFRLLRRFTGRRLWWLDQRRRRSRPCLPRGRVRGIPQRHFVQRSIVGKSTDRLYLGLRRLIGQHPLCPWPDESAAARALAPMLATRGPRSASRAGPCSTRATRCSRWRPTRTAVSVGFVVLLWRRRRAFVFLTEGCISSERRCRQMALSFEVMRAAEP